MGGGPFYLETTNIIQTKDQAVEEEEYDSEYEDEASEDIEEGDEDGDAKNKKLIKSELFKDQLLKTPTLVARCL